MTVPLAVQTAHLSHPALLAGHLTPPLSPFTPIKSHPVKPLPPPVVDYALLRSHHAYALRYVIAKLRWEQTNNDYLKGEDAWLNHIRMIQKLELELKAVEAAQSTLDAFPICFAPTAHPKAHGPYSWDQIVEENKKAAAKRGEDDAKLDAKYKFLRQFFIGPKTKQQTRNDRAIRDMLLEGDLELEDLSVLLESANYRVLIAGTEKAAALPPRARGAGGAGGKEKKTYEQVRMEKEKVKIAKLHSGEGEKDAPKEVKKGPEAAKRIGPRTQEEWLASLPVEGPKTKGEALLPVQREQRHAILTFLRKPWPEYDEEAAGLMERMGRLALKRLNQEIKGAKGEGKEGKDDKVKVEVKDEVKDGDEKEAKEGQQKEGRYGVNDESAKDAQPVKAT